MLKIFPVKTDEDIEIAGVLLGEYVAWLEGEELISSQEFQAFQDQLANLPGGYSPPAGRLLLAKYNGEAAGCIGLRKLSNDVCEMKRLYVKQKFRGLKIGRKLAEAIIEEAQRMGYTRIRGDTIPSMQVARALYASLGFKEIGPYEENIIEGAVFMELKLV